MEESLSKNEVGDRLSPSVDPPALSSAAPAVGGLSRRWLYLILATALLFVLMPFLFWQSTWFGRPLTDAQIEKSLADREHPRKIQHALSQIADRILSGNPSLQASVRRWYPQVVALSASGVDELRLTAAWVMGQDNTVPEFHQALLRSVADPHPMVRRNAALSLVRYRDATGRPVILGMLDPYVVTAPHAGTLAQRLKLGDVVNPGTLLARIQDGKQKIEVRSQVPGTLERWVAPDRAKLSAGEAVVELAPSPEMVWEALRALYLVGQPEDLPAIERYARLTAPGATAGTRGSATGMRDGIRQQAELAARAIRFRSNLQP